VDFATMELTIDSEAQTVQAGTDHAPELHISPGSTWPEYAFGEHRVMYSSFPISGSPGPTTATVSFRERWA
jgi:hypothetical protein